MPNYEKKPSHIPQNFEIDRGKIIIKGEILPPKPGITPIPKEKKVPCKPKKQMRFKDSSYLTTQQVTDEEYQIKNKIR